MAQPSPSKGFTLIELMTTIAVMAILTTIALADFVNPLVDMRQNSLAAEFSDTVSLARSEAQRRRQVVVLCPRSVSGGCQAGAANWNAGWVMFQDTDNDRTVDGDEAVIQVRSNLDNRTTLVATVDLPGTPIAMDPQGATIGLKDDALTFRFSDEKVSNKRYVVLGRAGRARTLAQADCTSAKGCTP
ncbi:GspH/FimT family pseudopilin [Ideonella paludis]|uniref:Type II secretion system protein H n=2 Tax=Ideonella paludis TaxID=1233411 RepID=A0ABS5DXG9_9BURK|nr:GspH/FimT family pseudopilin [Ideonella paludis]MBQ0935843.1 GspH/FimT family pseudopilin [Ideonella paludis]